MACGAAIVRLGQHGAAADRDHPLARPRAPDRVAHRLLDAVERHRLEKLAVGKLWQPFRLAADTHERLDVVVPGGDVGVANRPVDADAFARIRLEVEIAPAVDLPSPHDRAPAHLAAANPRERLVGRGRVRILEVVHEKLVGHLVARVTLLLDRLLPGQALAVALYEAGGIRGCEVGTVMFGRRPDGSEEPAVMDLVRLAIPRRTYTQSHIDYVIEVCSEVAGRAAELPGYRIIEQPPMLRHFTARFEPLPRR